MPRRTTYPLDDARRFLAMGSILTHVREAYMVDNELTEEDLEEFKKQLEKPKVKEKIWSN